MAIITISRGCYSHGKEIAERAAKRLGYECVSREILIEASKFFDVPEKKLLTSIHDAPSMLDRITHGKERYLAYIQTALRDRVKNDNVVYHGHAGHLLLRDFPQVLKVRIIADMKDRVAMLKKEKNIGDAEARAFIHEDDVQRATWTRYLYKKEVSDPDLYDMVIRIGAVSIDDARDLIVRAAGGEAFKLSPESKRALVDLAIESHLHILLNGVCDAEIRSREGGMVHIRCRPQRIRKFDPIRPSLATHIDETIREDLTKQVQRIAQSVPGVKEVICDVDSPYYS